MVLLLLVLLWSYWCYSDANGVLLGSRLNEVVFRKRCLLGVFGLNPTHSFGDCIFWWLVLLSGTIEY